MRPRGGTALHGVVSDLHTRNVGDVSSNGERPAQRRRDDREPGSSHSHIKQLVLRYDCQFRENAPNITEPPVLETTEALRQCRVLTVIQVALGILNPHVAHHFHRDAHAEIIVGHQPGRPGASRVVLGARGSYFAKYSPMWMLTRSPLELTDQSSTPMMPSAKQF